MDAIGLFQSLKNNPIALAVSVGLHIMLFVFLAINLSNNEPPQQKTSTQQIVKAYVVDAKVVEQEIKKLKQAEIKKQQKIKKQADEINQQISKEKKRLQKIKNQNKTLERQAKIKKLAEEKKTKLRKKAALKRQEVEAKRVEANKRKIEVARKKAALARKNEIARKKLEAEIKADAKRLAVIKKQKDDALAEKRRLVEEKEMKHRMAEEERRQAIHNEKLKSLRLQYVRLIEQKVERNWLRPVALSSDYKCEVFVTQSVLGDVINVRLGACASDTVFKNSIERAVRKSSPLPPPPNPEVFDREIRFVFKPSN